MSIKSFRPVVKTLLHARPTVLARSAITAPRAAIIASRTFSISQRRSGNGESDSSLSAAISAEHQFELETAASQPEIPEFLDAFKSQRTWEIQDNAGADDVILTRKFGNESLKLTFQISDLDPIAETSEELSNPSAPTSDNTFDGAATADAEAADPPYITVSLVITKAGSPTAMSIDMEAGEEGMVTTNVAMFESQVAVMEGSEGDWVRGGKYMGPQFEHLDAGVQEAFQNYLEERGVDDSLAQFILSYAEHKEQRDYVSWLEQVKSFVEK